MVRRDEAWCLPDGAVDIGDDPAGAAYDVVVIVADPGLIASDVTRRLNAPHQARSGQGAKNVVDRLTRDVRQAGTNRADNGLGVGMGARAHSFEYGHPRSGDS